MSFHLDRVHVWACEVPDEAGGVANKLHALAEAGANLQYVGTRRQPDRPGTGILYIAPVTGPEQTRAAKAVGLREVFSPVIVRVEGDNQSGLAARLTKEWALADISFTGLTMTVLGPKFIGYAAFDNPVDANKAATILAQIGTEAKAKEMAVKEPAMA
ncbi:MAG: amino acid-binding ACT [Gemmataceae bacterium]|nr:amino acid-binding ACT [Gemmataceae bacterium]